MLLRLSSCILGFLVHMKLPSFLTQALIKMFCFFYRIDPSQAEKSLPEYKCLGEFFSRRLKPELRPLGEAPIHPVDGKIFAKGVIAKEGFLLQAKSLLYSAESFLKQSLPEEFYGGFYVNYYLAPHNYHRVHSPVAGKLKTIKTISGSVWPVNSYFMENLSDLLIRNKRLLFFLEEKATKKTVIVAMVGALNVASLGVEVFEAQDIKLGEELGVFHMGSTVIVLYPKGYQDYEKLKISLKEVKMGESLS